MVNNEFHDDNRKLCKRGTRIQKFKYVDSTVSLNTFFIFLGYHDCFSLEKMNKRINPKYPRSQQLQVTRFYENI